MTVRLSHWIRLGAKCHPQAVGVYCNDIGSETCTCAMGAAYYAITGMLPLSDYPFPVLNEVQEQIKKATGIIGPEAIDYGGSVWSVFGLIAHLNDNAGWSRERIADLLENRGY